MPGFLYWRLSGFYLAYFGFVGAFTPFWSLYLKSLSFSAFQIAILMSLFQLGRIFSPSLWGWVADHLGCRVRIIQWLAGLSVATYLGVFFGTSFLWLFCVMLLLSFFWSAALPLIESVTLSHLGLRLERYGRIRLWGSIGFIAAVIGLGYLMETYGMPGLLWVVLGLLVGIWVAAQKIDEPGVIVRHGEDAGSIWMIIRRREVLALIAACFTMSAAHGAYYTFYSIYLAGHGYSASHIGWLWAVGVMCEIGVFLAMPKLTVRFGLPKIMAISLALAFIRFTVIGWAVESWWLILLAQTLHAATFGSYHAAAVALTHRYFQGKHQARGQGLYTSVSYGLGGTLGAIASGYTWEGLGPFWTFTLSGCCAMLGCILFMWLLPKAAMSPERGEARAV